MGEFLRNLFKRKKKEDGEEEREITICDRFQPVWNEARAYFILRITVAVIVLGSGLYVALQSKTAVDNLEVPKAGGLAAFLASSSGFAAIALPHCRSCIKIRSLRDLIKFDWKLCCKKDPSPSDDEVINRVEDYQKKLSEAAMILPTSGAK